jgi:hypothetical protein
VPLVDLLERGYFPKELPSPFVTGSFAKLVAGTAVLPGDFAKAAKRGNAMPSARPALYSHARGGLLRRQLSICNPLLYALLCKEIINNWAALQPKVAGTPFSATAPEFKSAGRAIDGKFPQSARSQLAQDTRLGRRFVLQTDISRFYDSIYTHSIAWAMHTKSGAKANRTLALLGNKLDYWVRMGQDQQTVGIPIGPDTSLVLAELIMQRCDEEVLRKLGDVKGHRFIDDYELGFRNRTDAEDAFHILDACLADFELALNPKKTTVMELPLPLESTWVIELKRFDLSRSTESGQAGQLANYFSKAFELHSCNPDEGVLQYAVSRLGSVKVLAGNWSLFQKLLLLCVAPEPASFPHVLGQIITRKNAGAAPILADLEDIANTLIVGHSDLRHSSEVAHALWACLALGLKLGAPAVDSISNCVDPVVALLALDCEQHNLVAKPPDKALWATQMTSEALYDDQWLLAYEANVKGWLPSVGSADHVDADVNFAFLKANGVSFYDPTRAAPSAAAAPIPLPTVIRVPILAARSA